METATRSPDQHSPAAAATTPSAIGFAEWILDPARPPLRSIAGATVHLTQAEHRILVLLARNQRQPVTRDQLMAVTAGRSWQPYDRSVDVHISNLRRKLDRDPHTPSLIRTVRGIGYMLEPSRSL